MRVTRRDVLAGLGLGAIAAGLAACGAGDVTSRASSSQRARLRGVVYGDSITRGGHDPLDVSAPPSRSWVAHTGDTVDWVGGAAVWGSTAFGLTMMMEPTPPADLVVFFFGTNDFRKGRTVRQMVKDIQNAHENMTNPPERVVLVAVGPEDNPQVGPRLIAWNRDVHRAAQERGWDFVDPWGRLRAGKSGGAYAMWASPETHVDHLHPTDIGAKVLGESMAAQLVGA